MRRKTKRHDRKDGWFVCPGFCLGEYSTQYFWTNWQYNGNSNCAQDTRNAHDNKLIALIWTSSTVLDFPGFFLNVWNNEKAACDGPWGSKPNLASKIYIIVNLLFTTYIPIVVFLFCYGSLIKGLYFSNEICAESTNEDNSEKKKLLITFILATSGFLLGYGPMAVFQTLTFFGKKIDLSLLKVKAVLIFLFAISLCLNPVLYAFRSSKFKEGFKRIYLHRSSQTVEQNEN